MIYKDIGLVIKVMEEVNKAMIKMRDTLVNYLGDWLDPGYIILTRKSNPLSEEEQDFK